MLKKMKVYLKINAIFEQNSIINESVIDANFLRKYLMSDLQINLTHFDFYIISKCKLLSNNCEKIIDSFKTDPFFVERQLTNIKCLIEPIESYQHLFSSTRNISNISNNIFDWPNVKNIQANSHSPFYLLEQFDQLFPNVSCIQFFIGKYLFLIIVSAILENIRLD